MFIIDRASASWTNSLNSFMFFVCCAFGLLTFWPGSQSLAAICVLRFSTLLRLHFRNFSSSFAQTPNVLQHTDRRRLALSSPSCRLQCAALVIFSCCGCCCCHFGKLKCAQSPKRKTRLLPRPTRGARAARQQGNMERGSLQQARGKRLAARLHLKLRPAQFGNAWKTIQRFFSYFIFILFFCFFGFGAHFICCRLVA